MRFIHSPVTGLAVAAMAAARMERHSDMQVIKIKREEPIDLDDERGLPIIEPEPAPKPLRRTGEREAARRLRQLAKRAA
jgi:hypothetical protein